MTRTPQIDGLVHLKDHYTVTSTQDTAFNLCPRRWWFRYVVKLRPEERKTYFTVGSCLSACTDRFVFGGPEGVVPTEEKAMEMTTQDPFAPGGQLWGQRPGQPVNLFPPHFHKVLERDGSWSELQDPTDRRKVIDMMNDAVETGVLSHMPGQHVERMVLRPLSYRMAYRSFLDHDSVAEGEVRDRKTAGASKSVLKPKALARNPQLLAYGMDVHLSRLEQGRAPLELYQLRHDVFQKWNGKTMYNYASEDDLTPGVSVVTLEKNWERLTKVSERMRTLLDEGPHHDWDQIEGPKKNSGACKKWGQEGCPYRDICSGTTPMKTIDIPSITPTMTSAPVPTPVPAADSLPWIPWANPSCTACGGSGLDKQLSHCLQCHGFADPKHQPMSGTSSLRPDTDSGEWVLRFVTPMPEGLAELFQQAMKKPGEPDPHIIPVIGHRIDKNGHVAVFCQTGQYPSAEDEQACVMDISQWGEQFALDQPPEPCEETMTETPQAPTPVPTPLPAPVPAAPQPSEESSQPEEPQPQPSQPEPTPEQPKKPRAKRKKQPKTSSEPVVEEQPAEPEASQPSSTAPDQSVTDGTSEAHVALEEALAIGDWPSALEASVSVQAGRPKVHNRGRQPRTFTLVVGPVSLVGYLECNGDQLVGAAMPLIARYFPESGGNYWAADKWKRREHLASMAPAFAELAKGRALRFQGADVENKSLLAALAALADRQIGV